MYPVDSWVDLLELLFNLLEYIERIIHTGTGYPEHISLCS